MKEYSTNEVARHNSAESCWVIIDSKVLDLTEFLKEHPGGADAILLRAGKDATKIFHQMGHSEYARTIMNRYVIGYCKESDKPESIVKARIHLEKRISAVRKKMIISPELFMYLISVVILAINIYTIYENPIIVSIGVFCGAYFVAQWAFVLNHLATHSSFVEDKYKEHNLYSVAFFHHYVHPHMMPKHSILHSISGFIPLLALVFFVFFFFVGGVFNDNVTYLDRLTWFGFFAFWILLEEPGHDYYHTPKKQRKKFFKNRYIHPEYFLLRLNEKIGLLSNPLHAKHHYQDVHERYNVTDFDDYAVPAINKYAEFVWNFYSKLHERGSKLVRGLKVFKVKYSFLDIHYFFAVWIFVELAINITYPWVFISLFLINLAFSIYRIQREKSRDGSAKNPAVIFSEDARLVKKRKIANEVYQLTLEFKKSIKTIDLCSNVFVFMPNHNQEYYHNHVENHEFLSDLERAYTPVHIEDNRMDLVIKKYKKDAENGFPDGGKSSQYLCNLKENELVNITAFDNCPFKLSEGKLVKHGKSYSFNNLLLIAGGSGITPFIRLLDEFISDRNRCKKGLKICLLYFIRDEADIIMKEKLDTIKSRNPDLFNVVYYKASDSVRINKEVLLENFDFKKSDSSLSIVCGPPSLLYDASKVLSELHFPKDRLIKL